MLSSWASWASKPDRPSHHANNDGTAFKNPWPSALAPTWTELLQSKFPLGFYEDLAAKHPGTQDVKVVKPDWGKSDLKERKLKRGNCIVGTSLGHAGVLTELPLEGTGKGSAKESFWVLFDPIFSVRAGPTQFTGPQRMKPAPCQVADLPGEQDIVTITMKSC